MEGGEKSVVKFQKALEVYLDGSGDESFLITS